MLLYLFFILIFINQIVSDFFFVSFLIQFDLKDSSIFLGQKRIDVGTAAKGVLREESESDRLSVRIGVQQFLKAFLMKVLDKRPLKYSLVRNLKALDPVFMASDPIGASTMMGRLVESMANANRVSSSSCDTIKDEFRDFLSSLRGSDDRELFLQFNSANDRVDSFLFSHLKPSCPLLWGVLESLLLLSHGQASVERGFSFNKEISVENLKANSLIARRHIVQYIKRHGGAIKVQITKELIQAANQGSSNYRLFLAQQKEEAAKSSLKRKRDEIASEIDTMRSKKLCMEKICRELELDANDTAKQAEAKQCFVLLSKSNGLREKRAKKMEELAKLDEKIKQKQAELSV